MGQLAESLTMRSATCEHCGGAVAIGGERAHLMGDERSLEAMRVLFGHLPSSITCPRCGQPFAYVPACVILVDRGSQAHVFDGGPFTDAKRAADLLSAADVENRIEHESLDELRAVVDARMVEWLTTLAESIGHLGEPSEWFAQNHSRLGAENLRRSMPER